MPKDETDNDEMKMKINRSKQSIRRTQMEIIRLQTMSLQLLLLTSKPLSVTMEMNPTATAEKQRYKNALHYNSHFNYNVPTSYITCIYYKMSHSVNMGGEHHSRPSIQQGRRI